VECKPRCVDIRRVSDRRWVFRLAFGVTGISDDWCRSITGVIVISSVVNTAVRQRELWVYLGAAGSGDDMHLSFDDFQN
jgi:hypothetical protein